jgi:DnaJ-class molecular chaperone
MLALEARERRFKSCFGDYKIKTGADMSKKFNLKDYLTETKECPTCAGVGQTETMTMLTYAGAQSWVVRECEDCNGSGSIVSPVQCYRCEEDVLLSDVATNKGNTYHKACLDEAIELEEID